MEAKIVLGLGFGDEGKGITTDWLCSRLPDPIVIRFSGGQQAGHTVMIGDKKHVHSSFGAGTLRGIPSYFSEHTTIYPNVIRTEMDRLNEKGINPKLYVHPLANLTTPYDVAWNRVTEKRNGHGSCGLGIAATMKRNIETPFKIYAVDCLYPKILLQKVEAIHNYYTTTLGFHNVGEFVKIVEQQWDLFIQTCANLPFEIMGYEKLGEFSYLIFEGSQGILLDMDHGFFPNVTYANTTSKNAFDIIRKLPYHCNTELYYATRCYQTRHGAGWMSNETPINLINNHEEINKHNEWQKDFRTGEFDYDLINYALKVDSAYSTDCPKNLMVTCRDQRPDWNLYETKLNTKFKAITSSYSPRTTNVGLVIKEGKLVA